MGNNSWEPPIPVLLNTWKHHAGVLRQRIQTAIESGDLQTLANGLVVIGTDLVDFYLGPLSPAEIGRQVVDLLAVQHRLEREAYESWVLAGSGYQMVTLSDDSRWVLRLGNEPDRYLHVHPGRYAEHTRRVRANVLKTAALALAYAGIHGGKPCERTLVNAVRQQYLGLAPIGRELTGDHGLGAIVQLLV
jgi:hypothetical protein